MPRLIMSPLYIKKLFPKPSPLFGRFGPTAGTIGRRSSGMNGLEGESSHSQGTDLTGSRDGGNSLCLPCD